MSTLRLSGILISLIFIGISFYRLRTYSEKRIDIWFLILFGLLLILVSLFPDLVNLPTDLISLGDQKGGRLITLLLISNIFLWALYFYERSKGENWYFQFDRWVRNSTVSDFLKEDADKILPGSIVILIPAYNEGKNLEIVLPRIPDKILNMPVAVLIIDDGSDDNTSEVSRDHGALVATQKTNRGGGAALKVGYEIIKKVDPAVIVTMDADGQHNPEEIGILVEPLLNNQSDFIIGSRILGKCEKYSWLRLFGVTFFSKIINLMIGTQITDCSSGFRAINKKVIENCLLFQEQYHTAEIIIEAGKRGFRIDERPVTITKRISGKSKKGKDFTYALYFIRTILKSWLR